MYLAQIVYLGVQATSNAACAFNVIEYIVEQFVLLHEQAVSWSRVVIDEIYHGNLIMLNAIEYSWKAILMHRNGNPAKAKYFGASVILVLV